MERKKRKKNQEKNNQANTEIFAKAYAWYSWHWNKFEAILCVWCHANNHRILKEIHGMEHLQLYGQGKMKTTMATTTTIGNNSQAP